jgi:ribosomal protein S18 acetylase RimI-like enzyme
VVEIRKVEVDDLELLSAALAAAGRDAPAADLFLRQDHAHAFVALDDGRAIGIAYGYEMIRPEGFWMLILYEIAVEEAYRREGVGRELLDGFVGFARSKGHRKMWLFTEAGNAAAQRLYEGAGGERDDTSVGYWWVFE